MESGDLNDAEKGLEKLSLLSDTVVDHCKVEWTFQNFLFSDVEDLIFESPKFDLTRSSTSWYLLMAPHYENNMFTVYLHIDPDDSVSASISVRFGFKDGEKEKWQTEIQCDVQQGTFEVDILEKASEFFDTAGKQITVLCQMIVIAEVLTSDEKENSADTSKMAFLSDFCNLYQSENLSDIKISVAGTELKAHKAILANRSTVFNDMLSGKNRKLPVLELCDENSKDVDYMLVYMYAGNFTDYIQHYPISLSLYDCIQMFEITDLKSLLAPREIEIVTEFIVQSTELVWEIDNISTVYKTFPEFFPERLLKVGQWCFKVHISCLPANDYVNLVVESLNSDCDWSIHLEISLLKANKERIKLPKVAEAKKLFDIPLFAKKEFLSPSQSDLLPGDVLTIFFNIEVSNFEGNDKVFYRQANITNSNTCNETVSFASLLESGDFSDLALISSGQDFSVHKAVLAARSVYFQEIFENCKGDLLYINDLNPQALKCLLMFMYSGKLEVDLDSAFEIYKVSDKYSVTLLDFELHNFFTSKCNPLEVCDLVSKADSYKVRKVRTEAIKYIGLEFDSIGRSASWDNLMKTNKKLVDDILSIMTLVYNFYKLKK